MKDPEEVRKEISLREQIRQLAAGRSITDALKAEMKLPSNPEYRRGKRGGAILINKTNGKSHHASPKEVEKYNLPPTRSYAKKNFKIEEAALASLKKPEGK